MKRTFKRIITLSLLLMSVSALVKAEKVSKEQAANIAKTFFENIHQTGTLRSAISVSPELSYVSNKKSSLRSAKSSTDSVSCFYVYNFDGAEGFVIVGADNVVRPILGYSTRGSFDFNKLPDNCKSWLEGYNEEIFNAINSGLTPDEEALQEWTEAESTSDVSLRLATTSVNPLIETQWNQTSPYNDLCPYYNGAARAATGCVATAMAQLMNYYNYPAKGNGSSVAYTTETESISIPSKEYETYDWSNMTNQYLSTSTVFEKNAVANLMYDCGISVNMDYAYSSGALFMDAAQALVTVFNYDRSIATYERVYFSNDSWESMLKEELNASRPILFSADKIVSGHAFICDGYNANGFFHFNWGWGGSSDGYYASNALLLPGTDGYNSNQRVLVNIKPNEGGVDTPLGVRINNAYDNEISKDSVKKEESFSYSAYYSNINALNNFTGELGVFLCLGDSIVELLGTSDIVDLSTSRSRYKRITCKCSYKVNMGNYTVKPYYRLNENDSWKPVVGHYGVSVEKTVYIKNQIVPKLTTYTDMVTTKSKVGYDENFFVNITFWDTFTENFVGRLGVGLVDSNDSILKVWAYSSSSDVTISSAYTKSVSLNCSVSNDVPAGTYKLKALAMPSGYSWGIVNAYYAYEIDELDLEVNLSTDIEIVSNENVAVYLNSASNSIDVINIDSSYQIHVFDINGVTVFTENSTGNMSIPMQGSSPGIYTVIVTTNENTIRKKVLVK